MVISLTSPLSSLSAAAAAAAVGHTARDEDGVCTIALAWRGHVRQLSPDFIDRSIFIIRHYRRLRENRIKVLVYRPQLGYTCSPPSA